MTSKDSEFVFENDSDKNQPSRSKSKEKGGSTSSTSNSSAMQELIKEQVINQAELERFVRNYKKTPKDKLKEGYIKERKLLLQTQWQIINTTHRKLLKLYSDADKERHYFAEDVISDLEETYCVISGKMNEQLLELNPPTEVKTPVTLPTPSISTIKTPEHVDIKLPRIEIPRFSGNYINWPSFHALFESLIDQNNQLNNVQKLHYLRSSVSGEAENLIKHLQLSESNYLAAWEILKRRYQNNRILVTCQLNVLTSMPNHAYESSHNLKKMLDKLNEVLEALKGLQINTTSWDPLIIHILSQKLTKDTITHWETSLSSRNDPNALPTINEFKSCLENRFRTLESIGGNKNLQPKAEYKQEYTKAHVSQQQSLQRKQPYQMHNDCPLCNKNHRLRECYQFIQMSPHARLKFIQGNNRCCNCFGKTHNTISCPKQFSCQKCKKRHNTMLHIDANPTRNNAFTPSPSSSHLSTTLHQENLIPHNPTQQVENINQNSAYDTNQAYTHLVGKPNNTTALLATALVKVYTEKSGSLLLRALIDQGSQISFITERSAQLLQATKKPTFLVITGVGNTVTGPTKSVIDLKLGPHFTNTEEIGVRAHVMKKITGRTPFNSIIPQNWSHIKRLQLADPYFFNSGDIDILLGVEVYAQIIEEGIIKGSINRPLAQRTTLGWIICGPTQHQPLTTPTMSLVCEATPISELIKKFWEVEENFDHANKKHYTEEEALCEEIYQKTHKRLPDGRYEVRLPFKAYPLTPNLGESRGLAFKRFISLEKKLQNNPNLKTEYIKFMREYISLGHMEVIENDYTNLHRSTNYIPHHSVIKEDSTTTKVRVVFDASAKSTNHTSLNDSLIAGPALQEDLHLILLRWRTHRFAFTADVEKMYRQIRIASEDTEYQRILWREDPTHSLKEYRLLTVTYGTSAAPFLAIRTLHQLALDERDKHELTSNTILRDFYVDDIMSGANTEAEAERLLHNLREVMNKGAFNLRKWTSNSLKILEHVPEEDRELKSTMEINVNTTIKTLGIHWNPICDSFKFKIKASSSAPKTKRELLSEIAKLFDPLGWMSPIVITTKILMQQLWLLKSNWDDELPKPIIDKWQTFRSDLNIIETISIPRWLKTTSNIEFELHGFCDASVQAYAAVIYLRVMNNSEHTVTLLTSKTRVAPIKQLSLPRLELCAASLVSKLITQVKSALPDKASKTFLWSDSTIVLSWLQGHPSKWKTFVANRVSDIHKETDGCLWRYVPTKDNPADCASRGLTPKELLNHKIWWNGPHWLTEEVHQWPENIVTTTQIEIRRIPVHIARETTNIDMDLLTKFSSWSKLIRITALCFRSHNLDEHFFVNNSDLELLQVKWHPASPTDSHILALLSDNTIRVYDEASLRHVWRVGPLPCSGCAVPSLFALGEIAVDFDIAPPRVVSSGNDNAKDSRTNNSTYVVNGNNTTVAKSKLLQENGDKVEWPIVILRRNGNVYVLCAGIDTDKPHLQGPLTFVPQTEDNYGTDSCAILVIPSLPPALVIAEITGKLHHALFLEAESPEEPYNEVDSTLNIYPSEWTVNVLETVELELGLPEYKKTKSHTCPIHLKRDFINELRYFAYHNTGLHVITINFIKELQRFVAADGGDTAEPPSLSTLSHAEYIVCTKVEDRSKVNAVLGFVMLQMPSGIILLVSSGQVISLKLIIDPNLFSDWSITNDNLANNNLAMDSPIQKILSESFVTHIQNIFKKSVNQPILSLDKSSELTPKQMYELLAQSIQVLREQYFKRHEKARVEILKRVKILKLLKEQQIKEIEGLEKEKDNIRQNAERLAEKFEDISEKQQILSKKCQDLIRQANICIPSNSLADKEFAEQVEKINDATKRMSKSLKQAQERIKNQQLHIKKYTDVTENKKIVLPEKQENTIKDILAQITTEIDTQIKEVKRINNIISL